MTSTPIEQKAPPKMIKQPSFFERHGQKLITLFIWLLVIGGYSWYARANDLGPVEAVQALADFFRSPYGPVAYFVVYALRPLLFFPATLLTLAGGSIFGPILGVILVVLSSNTSAMIAYGIGRYYGQGLLEEKEDSQTLIQRYARPLRQNSFETVMVMRFLFLPYDLVNYLCGFLRISWRPYLLATILGSIPGTIAFVLFGASIDISQGVSQPTFNPWSLAASILMVVISLVISRYFKRQEGEMIGPDEREAAVPLD